MIKLLQSTLIFQATGYLLQFLAIVFFAKVLGPEGQGILVLFRSTGQIIVAIIWFGLPASIIYFVGKDKNYFKSLLINSLVWFCFVFVILVTILFVLPVDRIPKIRQIEQYIPYLLAFVFLLSLFSLFQGLMLSLKNYLYYNLFTFGLGFIVFFGSVLTSFMSRDTDRLIIAIGCYLAAYSIMFIFGLILTRVEEHKLKGRTVAKLKFFDQFRVGFRGYISTLAAMLLFRLDMFLVVYFLSLEDAGIYSIALFGAEMIIKIPSWTAAILTPMVASAEKGHVRRTVYLLYSSTLIAIILGIFITLILTLFPMFIMDIIGRDYAGVEICLLFLLPRVVMQSGVGILAANLAGKGYPWYHPIGCIIPLVFVVIFDIILIPKFGIIGAALGNSLAYVSAVVVFGIGFKKYNKVTEDVRIKTYLDMLQGYLRRRAVDGKSQPFY